MRCREIVIVRIINHFVLGDLVYGITLTGLVVDTRLTVEFVNHLMEVQQRDCDYYRGVRVQLNESRMDRMGIVTFGFSEHCTKIDPPEAFLEWHFHTSLDNI